MPAVQRKEDLSSLPERLRSPALVEQGGLEDIFRSATPASPAAQLQARLLDAYLTPQVAAPAEQRVPASLRTLIIVGVSAQLWAGIAGVAWLLI